MKKLLSMILACLMGSGLSIGLVCGSDYDMSNGSATGWIVREDVCLCTQDTIALFNYPNYVIIVGTGNCIKNESNMVNGSSIPLQVHGMSAADAEDVAYKIERAAELCNLWTKREMACDTNIDLMIQPITSENYGLCVYKLAQLLHKTVIVIFGDVAVHIDCPTTIETCPECCCYGASIDNNCDALINIDLLNGATSCYCHMFCVFTEAKLPEIRTREVIPGVTRKFAVYSECANVTYIPVN
jgi:hypothetical protein